MKCPTCNQEIQVKAKKEDLDMVIKAWKIQIGVDKDDRAWDRVYFKRFARPAKDLLILFGNWKDAVDCIQSVYESLTDAGFSCTLDTVIKHANEYRLKLQKEKNNGGILEQGDVYKLPGVIAG